ncbi:hypothetical protein MNBD_CHLOROFLEXI01-1757 [hydrothermal vent metagenome]|uniref:DUF5615 domain-containing protein n=1 Tax=hydrothermal vent metagenome TaxID=652676 RepID=A0A3B0UKL0_9ZZZZ
MAKFYSNENFPLPVVEHLRQLSHDVLTIQEVGQADRAVPDEVVLAFAMKESRILLTFNRKHFIKLHRDMPNHSGIVVCTFDPDFKALANRIHQAIQEPQKSSGELIRVNRPQT